MPCAFSFAAPTPVGAWEFDDSGNLGKATIGNDLTIGGTAPTYSATLADTSSTELTGVITTSAGSSNYLRLNYNLSANGGGSYINQWTLVLDVFSPASSLNTYRSIYQTAAAHNTNDTDFYFNNSGETLRKGTGTNISPNAWDTANWHRMVISVSNTNFFDVYADGVLFWNAPVHGLDGLQSLNLDRFFLFADNSSDNQPLNIGAIAFYNEALSASDAAALGGAGSPMLIPEPSTYALLSMLAIGTLVLTRRRTRS